MAVEWVGSGALSVAVGAITPALPSGLATDDILILPLRSRDDQAASIANAAGGTWTEFTNSPQSNATDGVRGTFFWSRYNGTQTAPTTNDSGAINMGRIIAFRGCVATGDPYDATAGDTQTAGTSMTNPGLVTTVDDCLIVVISVLDVDGVASTANASAWTNASLASIDERVDEIVAQGIGGGHAVATGVKATAGTVSSTTWTQANSGGTANLTIALIPAATGPEEGTAAIAATVAISATGKATNKGTAAIAATVAVSATGEVPIPTGTAAIAIDVAISATGKATNKGTAAITASVAISATGSLPDPADRIIVAPTGSSGLTSGTLADMTEGLPWSDATEATMAVASLDTGVATFTGIDLSQAGGEQKGFWVWCRCNVANAAGFDVTLVVKDNTTTIWTATEFTLTNTTPRTFLIRVPDVDMAGEAINNLTLEFTAVNNLAGNNNIQWQFLRMSKSPFTTAEEASLPSTLVGQDFVAYLAEGLSTVGYQDNQPVTLWPDSSGEGRHAVVRVGSEGTLGTDGVAGLDVTSVRYVGALGYDPFTGAEIEWTDNKVFHAAVTPTAISEEAIFSVADDIDFFGVTIPDDKHILGVQSDGGGGWDWVLMSGDGTGPAHKAGGTATADVLTRVTEWVRIGGANEKMWEDDNVTEVVDAESGSNPFGSWSIGNRESDDRPYEGRIHEMWFVEATAITEGDIDTALDEWTNGAALEGTAAVAVDVAISATGKATNKGTAAIAAAVAISATGKATNKGTADVAVAVAVSATGIAIGGGSAAVAVNVAIAATGKATNKGTASIAVAVAIAATGKTTYKGSAAIASTVAVSATGLVPGVIEGQAAVTIQISIVAGGRTRIHPLGSFGEGSLAAFRLGSSKVSLTRLTAYRFSRRPRKGSHR